LVLVLVGSSLAQASSSVLSRQRARRIRFDIVFTSAPDEFAGVSQWI